MYVLALATVAVADFVAAVSDCSHPSDVKKTFSQTAVIVVLICNVV